MMAWRIRGCPWCNYYVSGRKNRGNPWFAIEAARGVGQRLHMAGHCGLWFYKGLGKGQRLSSCRGKLAWGGFRSAACTRAGFSDAATLEK